VPKVYQNADGSLKNKFIELFIIISNHNIFPVLFYKIASIYFIWKMYLYFSTENGQPMEPALCQ